MSKLRFGLSGDSFREEGVHFLRGGSTLFERRGGFAEEGAHFSRGAGCFCEEGVHFLRGGTLFERGYTF